MPEAIRRQDEPPRSGPDLWVVRLRKNGYIVATILAEHVWGCWVHWNGRNTEPCFEDVQRCPGHQRQLPLRWKGYLHIFDHGKRTECFFEVTPVTAESLLSQLGPDTGMRGSRVKFARMDGDKARVRVELMGSPLPGAALPATRDPIETLHKLWGLAAGKHLNGGKSAVPLSE